MTLTIPAGTATGNGYLVRVVASNPATTSAGTSAALTIVSNPTVTISPNTAQTISQGNSVSFTGTETPTATSREWLYGTTAGSYTTSTGVTAASYTFTPAATGTYYVVLRSVFPGCGAVTSAATQVTVTAPAPALTVSAAALTAFSTSTSTPSVAQSYTLTGNNLTADVMVTPPAGYEVSTTSATAGFGGDGAVIIVPQSGGSVSATLFVRLTGNAAGTYGTSGSPLTITHGSTTASASKTVYGTVTNPAISGVALAPTAVCTTSGAGSTSVSFAVSGTFAGTFTVQLSDASGSFAAPLATATGTGSPIALAVPQGTASGTGYLVRVLNSNPATTSSNSAALTVVNTPTVTISPSAATSITTDQSVAFSSTETPAATSRQWKYGTTVGTYPTNGGTGTTYTFANTTPGTYYVVLQSTFAACGIVTSAPTQVTVTSPAPMLTGIAPNSGQTGSTTLVTLTGTGFNTASVVNFNGSTLTPTFVSTTSLTVNLVAPAIAGPYPVSVTNPAPGGGTSGTQNFNATNGPLLTYKTATLTGMPPSVAANSRAANISSADPLARSSGLGAVSTAGSYATSGFGAALDETKYLSFGYTVAAGYSTTVTGVLIGMSRTNTGSPSAELRASTDGVNFTNPVSLGTITTIPFQTTPNVQFSFTVPAGALQQVTAPLYFRLYGYGATNPMGSTRVGDTPSALAIIVNGTVDTSAPIPRINVVQGSTTIANGSGSYAFAANTTPVGGSSAAVQFDIQNTGNAPLNLTGTPVVAISGADAGSFTVTQPAGSTVAGGSSVPFSVAFTPTSAGTKSATISIASNDSNATPYTFTVTGAPLLAPVVTSFTPTSGRVGTTVTITGNYFTAGSTVAFNGAAATTVTINSVTSISAVVPAGATTGPISVTNSVGTGTSSSSFTVLDIATGTLLLEDDFAYTSGQQLTSKGWTSYSGGTSSPVTTVAGNLTNPEYPRGFEQTANAATFAGSSTAQLTASGGQDIYRQFGATGSSTVLYASAVVNVTTAPNPGSYFLLFSDTNNGSGSGDFRGRVYIQSSGTGFLFGVSLTASTGSYATPIFTYGRPYLVVVRLNLNPDFEPNATSLYVFDAQAASATEPTTPLISVTGTLPGTATGSPNAIALRQDVTAVGVDGLRVGTGWGSVIGKPILSRTAPTLAAGNYYNVTVSNTATTTGAATIENNLALTSGNLTTTSTNSLTLAAAAGLSGGSASSYVNGPLRRTIGAVGTATPFAFPIGKGIDYRPFTLNVGAQTGSTIYQAELFNQDAGTTVTAPLVRVNRNRFYTVTPYDVANPASVLQPQGFTGTATLSFGVTDRVTDPSIASFVVAKRDNSATSWASTGPSTAYSGTATNGTVTSNTFTSFSDFALGSTDPSLAANPLPVQLIRFSATRVAKGVQVTWATASELNSAAFEVERSLDGKAFVAVARVAAQGSTTQAHEYASLDGAAPAAQLYYRLRQVDTDGTVAYSPAVTVAATEGATAELALSPNPAHESISLVTDQPTAYVVRNTLGQLVRQGTTVAGTTTVPVAELANGVYFFELHTGASRVVRKFVKE